VDRLAEARETARRHASRALHVYQDEDGMMILRGRLAPEVGAMLVQALAAARERLYRQARTADAAPDKEAPTVAQQQADALGLLAETALHHGIDPGAPGERYQVVVHVDAPVLADPEAPGQSVLEDSGTGSGDSHMLGSAETSQRLACDHRDRGCRFSSCGLPFGQGHHIHHWATAARPRSRTWRCSVASTIARCTRRVTKWSDSRTASSDSCARTAGHCPKSQLRQTWRTIPSTSCERGTRRRGCGSTHGRRCPVGWGNA